MLQNVLLEREIYASEEHKMMQKMIRDFINNEIIDQTAAWEKDGMVSREIWERAGELGLLCLDMPEQYGGSGLDFSFSALFIEELAKEAYTDPIFDKIPKYAGESLIYALARDSGKYNHLLRFPPEDSQYEKKKMDKLGL